ncbi:SDR family NAD(P)-dependent oxidoreductase [Streptomyces sp. FIT100]|uniref:SDR family NAD(P)-dependent oxidoreductase n=1 Tax=Streptomyces sp. FIT100 TaxID=2837956 RepID=UPI0021C8FF83|nr:SDR family NAD(P)-dependent oxidoreductase [Streptomyces sp. FIT100]UUN30649.1 SDR family NAD(P)-dependent oxidoreductase [Streptomyces sp. FIT100]
MSTTPTHVVLVTGAATGIGNLTARTLADAGHTVYASMRDPHGRNADRSKAMVEHAAAGPGALHVIELDVLCQESAERAADAITEAEGRLDAVVHNAGRLVVGVTEAFSAQEVLHVLDTNAVGALRVNRAVLPHFRARGAGLLLYVGSVTSRINSPFQGPYVAAKAALDALAQATAFETVRYGIDTSIVMPGAFTDGTDHFAAAAGPADREREAAYDRLAGLPEQLAARLDTLVPAGTAVDPGTVADEVARILALPAGTRPFRSVVDFQHHGAEQINEVAERMQADLMNRMGIGDLHR